MEASVPDLSQQVQALPQELQDIIFDFTIALAPGDKKIKMSKDYKAPWRLQINRATRQKQAPQYFGQSIFSFQDSSSQKVLFKILQSMTACHRSMIACLRLEVDWTTSTDSGHRLPDVVHKDAYALGFLSQLHEFLEEDGVSLPYGALQMNVPADTAEGRVDVWLSLSHRAQE